MVLLSGSNTQHPIRISHGCVPHDWRAWRMILFFVPHDWRAWRMSLFFVPRDWRAWVMLLFFVPHDWRAWIMSLFFVPHDWRAWIMLLFFQVQNNLQQLLMRKHLISMCFLLSMGQYLCWWTISSWWYNPPSSQWFGTDMVY